MAGGIRPAARDRPDAGQPAQAVGAGDVVPGDHHPGALARRHHPLCRLHIGGLADRRCRTARLDHGDDRLRRLLYHRTGPGDPDGPRDRGGWRRFPTKPSSASAISPSSSASSPALGHAAGAVEQPDRRQPAGHHRRKLPDRPGHGAGDRQHDVDADPDPAEGAEGEGRARRRPRRCSGGWSRWRSG